MRRSKSLAYSLKNPNDQDLQKVTDIKKCPEGKKLPDLKKYGHDGEKARRDHQEQSIWSQKPPSQKITQTFGLTTDPTYT